MAKTRNTPPHPPTLRKCPTGIIGLDEITEGGLPRGRTTLVCGGPGCGKTLLATQFVVNGILDYKEPGVLMAFEETVDELAKNFASLGIDLKDFIRRKLLAADYVHIERSEIEETGEYDLEGLFVRLGSMIDEVGAKRVVLDTTEALFAGLPNEGILRAELRRLFRWLKARGITSVVTAERGEVGFSRHGLEEYVSDCVIVLDHRVENQIATRRLRVVKYRGSRHGNNEYPSTIDAHGLHVVPISSLGLRYPVTEERVSTGIPRLDSMLGGLGYYRGSSVLISGPAGTGKTSIATCYVDRACARGEKCLYVCFEESPEQIKRNMASIGFDLARWEKRGLLKFHALRPSIYGLESHLGNLYGLVEEFRPTGMVVDPITSLAASGEEEEVKAMLIRLIDFIKNHWITAMFTALTEAGRPLEQSEVGISSLMDTWVILENLQSASERNRVLYVLKSRGMAHSNQMREFRSERGIELIDVYVGPGAVLTGAARLQQEARDQAQAREDEEASARRAQELKERRLQLEAQVHAMQLQLAGIDDQLGEAKSGERARLVRLATERRAASEARSADPARRGKRPGRKQKA